MEELFSKIAEHIVAWSTVAVIVLEIVLRLVKSSKVQSIFRLIPKVLHGVSKIFEAVASIFDKVVPDRQP